MTVAQSLARLDATWLDDVLGAGGSVHAVSVEPLAFTGATTDLARIRIDHGSGAVRRGGSGVSGPTSLIAKIRGVTDVQRQMDAAIGMFHREACFYRQLAAEVPVGSPRCFHVGDGDTTPLLLEDLGGHRMGDQVAGLAIADAETMMRTLARLHAAYWESPVIEQPWLLRHDTGAYPGLVAQLVQSGTSGLVRRFGDAVPGRVLDGVLALAARWDQVLSTACAGPPTLVHNDCRLDNVFFAEDGAPCLIDWQVVSRTRGTQDVANLLAGSMNADDLATHWERLLRLYHDGLVEHGVSGYGFDEALRHYRQNVFFPLGAGIALLGAMSIDDDRSLGEVITRRCLRHIDDIDALEAL